MLRALVEFRIRGVKVRSLPLLPVFFRALLTYPQTNIPFLFRLLTHDVFIGGKTWTTVSDHFLESKSRPLLNSAPVH